MELYQPFKNLRHTEFYRFRDVEMNAAYQFLFAPSQQSVYNALIGRIRSDIEMINPSGMPYQVNDKSKGCEALFSFNEKSLVIAGQTPAQFFQTIQFESQYGFKPSGEQAGICHFLPEFLQAEVIAHSSRRLISFSSFS